MVRKDDRMVMEFVDAASLIDNFKDVKEGWSARRKGW